MTKKIAVGGEDFIALRKADSYYVDKTELLYELVEETNNSVTLFTCPRWFWKTHNNNEKIIESEFCNIGIRHGGLFDLGELFNFVY